MIEYASINVRLYADGEPLDSNTTTELIWRYWRQPTEWGDLVGQSRLLALGLPSGTPIGILLDRLEECPQEVEGAGPQVVREAVAHLRTKYPNGV